MIMADQQGVPGMDLGGLENVPLTVESAGMIVGALQAKLYGERPINSMESFHAPVQAVKENGHYIVTEIRYGNDYPNSYLDITYPCQDTKAARPTVVYTHGGGYFGGSKIMSDPLAAGDPASFLFDEIVSSGCNFVNVDYALTPAAHFPAPLIQLTQAIDFLAARAGEYGLDMTNVVVMGSSAGAILTAQYGTLLANPDYQDALDIHPSFPPQAVKALVVDDGSLLPENFNWGLKVLLGNYMQTLDTESEIVKKYNATRWFNAQMAPAFFDAGTIDGFPADMRFCGERLTELGVENEVYIPKGQLPHGFLNLAKENEEAAEGVRRILAFIQKHTKNPLLHSVYRIS